MLVSPGVETVPNCLKKLFQYLLYLLTAMGRFQSGHLLTSDLTRSTPTEHPHVVGQLSKWLSQAINPTFSAAQFIRWLVWLTVLRQQPWLLTLSIFHTPINSSWWTFLTIWFLFEFSFIRLVTRKAEWELYDTRGWIPSGATFAFTELPSTKVTTFWQWHLLLWSIGRITANHPHSWEIVLQCVGIPFVIIAPNNPLDKTICT